MSATGLMFPKRRPKGGALVLFDPDKALKRMAVAKVAEKYYTQVKDFDKLYASVEEKLIQQADFVAWWDTQVEKDPGTRGQLRGRDSSGRTRSGTARKTKGHLLIAGENGMPSRNTLSRWRRRLGTSERLALALSAAAERCAMICAFERHVSVTQNTGALEWYTPAEYVEAARTVMGGIDLDPASSDAANEVVGAAKYFTVVDNGLEQRWMGRVWMNPPYAQPLLAQFCACLMGHVRSGDVSQAVVMVLNGTETVWFADLASVASAACFPLGRVKFWHPSKGKGSETGFSTPLQGQVVLYAGKRPAVFRDVFKVFGWVVVPAVKGTS